MEEAKKLELKRIEKFKLIYIYFFPVVFLSFTSLYMLVNGEDPKGFFLTNVLISQTLILIPFILSVCMLAAKLLYKEKDMNELMLNHPEINVSEVIKQNLYSGIMAQVKIQQKL